VANHQRYINGSSGTHTGRDKVLSTSVHPVDCVSNCALPSSLCCSVLPAGEKTHRFLLRDRERRERPLDRDLDRDLDCELERDRVLLRFDGCSPELSLRFSSSPSACIKWKGTVACHSRLHYHMVRVHPRHRAVSSSD
jgi:hypothetical protein